ncbi:PglL family O-oligosaccharyltransferase, partial [Tepidimonas sp.]|uniref:PglL family O-oligosaccharyltransferase n=1 Tax=Tepidimonas sp. TaxID=2002775 RepID=UPI002FE234D3
GAVALAGWLLLQYALNIGYGYWEDYWLFAVYLLLAALAYAVGAEMARLHALRGLVWAVVLAAFASALIGIGQWVGGDAVSQWNSAFLFPLAGSDRMVGNLAQANQFGTLCLVGLWLGWAILAPWCDASPARQGAAVILAAVQLTGVYLSGSRTAVLNLWATPVWVLLWLWWQGRSWRTERMLRWMLGACAGWLILQAALPALSAALGWTAPPVERTLTQDDNRLRLWQMALQATTSAPWLGLGPAGMAHAHVVWAVEFGSFDNAIAAHAHNTVLDLLVVFGWPLGGLAVLGGVTLWLLHLRGSHNRTTFLLWLACTTVLTHALLEYPLHFGMFLWLVALLLGAATQPQGVWAALHGNGAAGDVQAAPCTRRSALMPGLVRGLAAVGLVGLGLIWQAYVELESLHTLWRQQGGRAAQQALPAVSPRTQRLFPGLLERVHWFTLPEESIGHLDAPQRAALHRLALIRPASAVLWRAALDAAVQGNAERSAWYGERICAMYSPEVCNELDELWRVLGSTYTHLPHLPWKAWAQRRALSSALGQPAP